MIRKLPWWVEIGGFTLTGIAGFINVIGLLGVTGAVSHLTGTSSYLSMELAGGNFREVVHLLTLIVSFFLGSALSGYIIGDSALKLGRRYSVALLCEGVLLFITMLLLTRELTAGQYFASMACGLQNAMTSTYSGAIVRTTHLSGVFTDLGVSLGLWFRGHKSDMRKTLLHITLVCGFIAGGVIGTFCFNWIGFRSIIFPAAVTVSLSISYWIYWKKTSVSTQKV